MQFSAIIAIAFSSAVMASPSIRNKVARQDLSGCTPVTFDDAGCAVGTNFFCSNVNFGSTCPDGQVERFDDATTRANEDSCAASTGKDENDVCDFSVLCCPA